MSCILVIDDDGDTREALSELLNAWGVRVRAAANGIEGIAQLSYETPALILLDTWMPAMGGDQFLDWLDNRSEYDTVPAVVMTADSGAVSHPRALAVLQKPYDLDQLLRYVRQFCPPPSPPARIAAGGR